MHSRKKIELTPPDKKQCQALRRITSWMTLGGPACDSPEALKRCEKKAEYIIKENAGNHGSMSVCKECLEKAKKQLGKRYFVATEIKPA